MIRPKPWWLIFILFMSPAFTGNDIYGYFESQQDVVKIPGREVGFGYSKLRVDLDAAPSNHFCIRANLIARFYDGRTTFDYFYFLDESLLQFPEDWADSQVPSELLVKYEDDLFIDNAFLEIYFEHFDLTLGRQQISPGVGYVWNHTDVFNRKDVMDPTYEQSGVPAVRGDFQVGSSWTLTGIFQSREDWDQSTIYWQLKRSLGSFDCSAVYARTPRESTSIACGAVSRERDLLGLNLEGSAGDIGMRSELVLHRLDQDGDSLYLETIVGADYTFDNSLYVLGEFLVNELGTKPEDTGLNDYLSYLEGQSHSINRNYAFLTALYPWSYITDAGFSFIANLDDESFLLSPQVTVRPFDDVEVTVWLNLFAGSEDSEYGYQEHGARVRIRAYF